MKTQAFHFEIKDLVTQFVAAFDDIIIKQGIYYATSADEGFMWGIFIG